MRPIPDSPARTLIATALASLLALTQAVAAAPADDRRVLELGDVPADDRRTLEVEDFARILPVESPRISPDGEWVAYTVTSSDIGDNREETRVWTIPIAGGDPLPMTAAGSSARDPRWSPDGRYLSFLAARDGGTTQVWVLDRRGGEARQLTDLERDVEAYRWSPNGTRLALVLKDEEPEGTEESDGENGEAGGAEDEPAGGEEDEPADEASDAECDCGEREELPEPWVIDRLQFKQDYVGYLTGDRRDHVYVYDIDPEALRQVTFGDSDDSSPEWSPDGERIAFVSNRTDDPDSNYNTDIWVVEVGDGESGGEGGDAGDRIAAGDVVQITTSPGPDRSLAWSPDGRWIAHVSDVDVEAMVYATSHLAVSAAAGGETRVLTESLDRNVGQPAFSGDGETIWFALEDSAERHLATIPATGGEVSRPIAGPLDLRDFDLGPDGTVVAQISEPHLPDELFVMEPEGEPEAGAGPGASGGASTESGATMQDGSSAERRARTRNRLRRLTHVNDDFLSKVRLGDVRNVEFPSRDGTEIEGFIVLPPDYEPGVRYPTLLRIHGGPVAQYSHAFNFEAQLFAAHGYVVVMTNPRGSSGYGQDFSLAIWRDWGGVDYEDVMAGVDYATEAGYADPERLGVGGWSYGGILTNNVIVKTDRFAGAISGAGASLYVAMYGHDQYQRWYELELGLPWENREVYERISPLNYVENAVTPTLFIGGEKDWNVPIINSELMYQSMKRLGRETQLVVYPGQYHGIDDLPYLKDLYERYLAWYGKYVKGNGP